MKLDNLKKLIRKVEDAESNIASLQSLMEKHAQNVGHNYKNAKLMFSVYGTRTEATALSVDDDLMAEAITSMIERAIELNAKDKQVIEAIELMVNPDSSEKPRLNVAPLKQPAPMPQQAPMNR